MLYPRIFLVVVILGLSQCGFNGIDLVSFHGLPFLATTLPPRYISFNVFAISFKRVSFAPSDCCTAPYQMKPLTFTNILCFFFRFLSQSMLLISFRKVSNVRNRSPKLKIKSYLAFSYFFRLNNL